MVRPDRQILLGIPGRGVRQGDLLHVLRVEGQAQRRPRHHVDQRCVVRCRLFWHQCARLEIWLISCLTGGPGCSSALGAFMELGEIHG